MSDTPLPSPADRPNADIVIYDGHCRICTAESQQAAVVGLPEEALLPVAARSGSSPPLARPVARSADARDVHRRPKGPPLGARGDSLSHSPLATIVVGSAVRLLPGQHAPLWRPLYRWVARNRYRLRGNSGVRRRWHLQFAPRVGCESTDSPCSFAGNSPLRTSSRNCVTASMTVVSRSAYALTNLRHVAAGEAQQVVQHEHLAVAVGAGADADRGDRQLAR